MRPDFAIFVLSNGRAETLTTVETLREFKYTGKIFVVIDDEDPAGDAYRARFENVLVFSKAEIASRFDEGDNIGDRRSVFYARNACWDLARQVGVRYFMQCDDDYGGFYVRTNAKGLYGSYRAEFLDHALEAMIEYFATIPALSIAMAQGGDYMSGATTHLVKRRRKAMNTFLCDVERPFRFVGRINEDVNTFTSLGRAGELFDDP